MGDVVPIKSDMKQTVIDAKLRRAPDSSILGGIGQKKNEIMEQPSPNLILCASVLDVFTLGVILPVIPSLFSEFGMNTTHQGWASSLYSLLSFFMGPLFGRWSDVHGRTIFLKVAGAANVLGLAAALAAPTKWAFLAARVLPGALRCQVPLTQAYLADVSSPQDRQKNFGLFGASFGLGFIFGPLVGGLAAQANTRLPLAIAVCAAILYLIVVFMVKEPHKQKTAAKAAEEGKGAKKKSGWSLIRSQGTGALALLFHNRFAFVFGEALYQATFIPHFSRRFGLQGREIGMLLSLLGVLSLISNLVIVRYLTRKFKECHILIVASLTQAVCMLVVFSSGDMRVVCAVLAVMSVNSTAFNTLTSAQISKSVSPEHTGTVMGFSSAADTIVRIICPPLAGYIFETIGHSGAGISAAGAILYCSVGTMSAEAVGLRIKEAAPGAEGGPVDQQAKKQT
mmetsp:Transcript_11059/g.15507  ORF Transcript_11059/g.15507 Transcript_11059/m.15507 type:complete len:453 (+) Transcript_11059:131-1489(+)